MAYTTINKHTDYFNTKLYNGTGSDGNSITGVGHTPDFIWIKQRNQMSHRIYDKIRGVNSALISNGNNAGDQYAAYGQFESFDSDGFTVGAGTSNGHGTNENGESICSWNWKANGAGSANTDGTINSTVSVNTTAGFSIVKYTGTGSAGSVGHGLGVKPDMIISKIYSTSGDWNVYHDSFAAQERIKLNSTAAKSSNSSNFASLPTNQVVNIGTGGDVNTSGATHMFYCFASKTGYSKFGTYTGNGNADGAFIYTGFRPEFSIIKPTSATGNWQIHDTKRDGYNVKNDNLAPNNDAAEADNQFMDILSNGFKLRSSTYSASGVSYIYAAFGQSLVGSNNVPCTAR